MKILLVGSYAAPVEFGGNKNFFYQAKALTQAGLDITILTSSADHTWSNSVVGAEELKEETIAGLPCKCFSLTGIKYFVGKYPPLWFRRDIEPTDWDAACAWARIIIAKLKPDIVHLQFWRGHLWVLEAAQSMGVSTVYTAHDFGLGCSRTVLLKGNGDLCDGIVGKDICARCVMDGRSILGLANEVFVRSRFVKKCVDRLYASSRSEVLHKYEVLSDRVENRVERLLSRAKNIFSSIDAVFTSNPLATEFFGQFVDSSNKLHEIPWYSVLPVKNPAIKAHQDRLCLGYMGRISEEKGLDILLDAMARVQNPVKLKIAGTVKGKFAILLRKKAKRLKHHKLEWLGWVVPEAQRAFYEEIDALVVPSRCMDNLPLSILDAFSQKVPVICPNIPSLTGAVRHKKNGLLFEFNSAESLADSINLISQNREILDNLAEGISEPFSLFEYINQVIKVYEEVLKRSREKYFDQKALFNEFNDDF